MSIEDGESQDDSSQDDESQEDDSQEESGEDGEEDLENVEGKLTTCLSYLLL